MFVIKSVGIDDLLQGLTGMERQIPYAVANGLNVTARRVKSGIQTAMASVFDRPTPFVMNSLQMSPARAPRGPLESRIWFRDPPNLGTKDHFLLPQVEGGNRPLKPFEMGMGGRFVTPSKYARLDQYGNLGRGQITKLLSISGGFHEVGFSMNARSNAKRKEFFRILQQKGKLAPGIYQRVVGDEAGGRAGRYLLGRALAKGQKIKGGLKDLRASTLELYPRGLQPVVLFPSKAPTYRMRLDFYGIAKRIVDDHYRQDVSRAVEAEIVREVAYRARH
jgi:hypothetical protein